VYTGRTQGKGGDSQKIFECRRANIFTQPLSPRVQLAPEFTFPASWRSGSVDGLRLGVLLQSGELYTFLVMALKVICAVLGVVAFNNLDSGIYRGAPIVTLPSDVVFQ
jgi:hypothetical protein